MTEAPDGMLDEEPAFQEAGGTEVEMALPAMTVKDLLDEVPLCLRPGDSIGLATIAMLAQGVTAAPVVDDRGRPLGLITAADLVGDDRGDTVRERMQAPPVVTEDTPVAVAVRVMAEAGLVRLVAIDRGGQVAGLVRGTEVLRAHNLEQSGRSAA